MTRLALAMIPGREPTKHQTRDWRQAAGPLGPANEQLSEEMS